MNRLSPSRPGSRSLTGTAAALDPAASARPRFSTLKHGRAANRLEVGDLRPHFPDTAGGQMELAPPAVCPSELLSDRIHRLRRTICRGKATRSIEMHRIRPLIVRLAATGLPARRCAVIASAATSASSTPHQDDDHAGLDNAGSAPARRERVKKLLRCRGGPGRSPAVAALVPPLADTSGHADATRASHSLAALAAPRRTRGRCPSRT